MADQVGIYEREEGTHLYQVPNPKTKDIKTNLLE